MVAARPPREAVRLSPLAVDAGSRRTRDDRAATHALLPAEPATVRATNAQWRCLPIVVMSHGPNGRQLVSMSRDLRDQLTESNSGDVGVNRLADATNAVRSLRLQVPQIILRRAAVQKDEDAMLGSCYRWQLGFSTHIAGQRQAEQSQRAEPQQFATARAAVGSMCGDQ